MDNKFDEQCLIIQAKIYANKKNTDEKLTKLTEYLKVLKVTITFMMDQTNN